MPLMPSRNKTDPAPWIPAEVQHTSEGVSEEAELYMIRAVNTGIINLSLAVQESGEKLRRVQESSTVKKPSTTKS